MVDVFKINNFSLNLFPQKDISIIYNGIKSKSFNYIVLEAKLSKNKITEMIKQLKRDKNILGKMTNQTILYCGIINANEVDMEITNIDFDCIILGIKNSHFFGKDITKFYDWPLIKQVNQNQKELNEIKTNIKGLESRVGVLEKNVKELIIEIKNMNSKIDKLLAKKEKGKKEIESMLNKKRKESDD